MLEEPETIRAKIKDIERGILQSANNKRGTRLVPLLNKTRNIQLFHMSESFTY